MEIKAKVPELDRTITIDYDFGANLDEAVQKFGGEVIYEDFIDSAVITLQSAMRSMARAKKTDEEIATALAEWKPGVSRRGKTDPIAGLMARFGKMTPEKQQELIEKLLASK